MKSGCVCDRLFDWLVIRINDALKGKEDAFVGILDTFGFEIFENNSFEQLCINYTNEKLQQLFNKTTFKEEEALYEREKIRFTHVEFIDNQIVLDLIEQRPTGVLPLLDDECLVPEGSDAKFMLKLEQAHASHPKFQTDTKRKINNSLAFEIQHYAGVVGYDASAFSDKNKDTFFADCYELCGKSSDKLTQALFPKLDSRLQTKSLSAIFCGQLNTLMDKLNATRTRYIRCIKPNDKMAANDFNVKLSLEQLTYSGVFEAVQIRKQGYPFRWTYAAFATRYRCINPNYKYKNKVKGASDTEGAKALCREILEASPQDFSDAQFGVNMLLYRAKEHRLLKLLRNLALETIIPRLQKYMRGLLPREMKRRLLKAEKAIGDALDRKNDYTGLKEAIDQVEPTIGTLRKIFPEYNPRNLAQGKKHLADLKKWVDLEKELEAILAQDANKPAVYKELWRIFETCEELISIPRTAKQRELHERARSEIAKSEVGKLDIEAKEAKSKMHRDRMEEIVSKANGMGHSSAIISELQQLLALPEKEFVIGELKAAERDGDSGRIIHRKIRLVEISLDEEGSQYANFFAYASYRTPDDFASAKFFGKSHLRQTVHKYDKAVLPTSLMKSTDAGFKKESIAINKLVLGFAGDAKDKNPDQCAITLLAKGKTTSEMIRDEIFAQVIKQLTQNPHGETLGRYWILFGLLCNYVHPSDAMEKYIMMFLRNHADNRGRKYLSAMNECKYGSTTAPTSVGELQSAIGAIDQLDQTGSRFSIRVGSGKSTGPTTRPYAHS